MALLTASNLSLGYDSHAIIENLNFTVNAGDYLCIVGENGSGKTTLMKTLLHLQEPLKGWIEMGDGLRKNEIGYLPQQTVIQKDFPASVKEIVLSGCQGRSGFRPFYNQAEKRLAAENMERMGISELSGRCYRELSGGQQQRVLLARALCATQKVLLLDEPVSGLDPRVTAEMYSLIKELNDDGITIIMISHDVAAALQYATHILHIGEDVFFGTRDEYLESDAGQFFLMHQKDEKKDGHTNTQKDELTDRQKVENTDSRKDGKPCEPADGEKAEEPDGQKGGEADV
ncbi:MAG: metal ABC transporter ATP-binding protein [Lachnospiraceae bacterium]|nr:metal ABC transporter ATP-binding protein [Lachnospiraceae bacterium]